MRLFFLSLHPLCYELGPGVICGFQVGVVRLAVLLHYLSQSTARDFMPPCEILCGCSWPRHGLWRDAVSLRDLMLKPAGPWMDPYFHLSIHCILIVFYCGDRSDRTAAKSGFGAVGSFRPFPASCLATSISAGLNVLAKCHTLLDKSWVFFLEFSPASCKTHEKWFFFWNLNYKLSQIIFFKCVKYHIFGASGHGSVPQNKKQLLKFPKST